MISDIEERVVKMEFENEDFKRGANETIKTLEALDNKLQLKNATTAFTAMDKAANKVDFTGLTRAIDQVSVKFSALQIAGITAIQNITNRVINAGENLVKSLSIDQVTAGFSKYEEKTKAVRTIMNSTGKSVEEVTEALKQLNWFTDETSYNFTDMVNSIGKFTNNRVPLERAISSMEGIANVAASAGAGINEASRAMYNFSQAISTGAVRLIDWKSIENANMATAEFKQTIIDTALELGTLEKVGDQIVTVAKGSAVSVTNFNEALQDEWFTSDVLVRTLEKYSEYADEVFKIWNEKGGAVTTASIMDALGETTMTLGQKAFQAAQEYKTFADAIGATKDAVSTGWMNSFEIIFGNVDEAKEIWTALGEELYEIFAGGTEARNQMLEAWKEAGGRDQAIEAIGTAWTNLKNIVGSVATAIREVFPPMTSSRLLEMTKGFADFVSQLKLSDKALNTLRVAAKLTLIPIKALTIVLQLAGRAVLLFVRLIWTLANGLLSLASDAKAVEKVLTKIFGAERYKRLAAAFNKIGANISHVFDVIRKKINISFGDTSPLQIFLGFISKIGKALEPVVNLILDGIVFGIEKLASIDTSGFEAFIDGAITKGKEAFEALNFVINDLKKNFMKFIRGTTGTSKLKTGFDQLKALGSGLVDTFKSLFGEVSSGSAFAKLREQAEPLINVFISIGNAIKDLMAKITPAKILVFSFGTALTVLLFSTSNLLSSISGLTDSVGGFVNAFTKRLKPNPILQYAKALTVLVAALVALTLIDPARLQRATQSMLAIMITLGTMTAAVAAVNKFLVADPISAEMMKTLSISMLAMAGAIVALSAGLKILSLVNLDNIIPQLLVLAGVVAGLILAAKMLSKSGPDLSKGGLYLLTFSLSVGALVTALVKLDGVDLNGVSKNIGALMIVVATMILLSKAAGEAKFGGAAGLILMVSGLMLLVKALKKLAKVDINDIMRGMPQYMILVLALGALGLALRAAGQNALKGAIGLTAIMGSLILLGLAIKVIGKMNLWEIIKGGYVVATLMLLVTGLGSLMLSGSKEDSKGIARAGSAFFKMGVAVLLLSAAIHYLGSIDLVVLAKGTVVISALMGLFALIIFAAKGAQKANKGMASIAACIGALSAVLVVLTLLDDWEATLAATVALSAVLLAFGGALKLMEKTKFKLGSAITSVAMIAALTAALGYVFANIKGLDTASVFAVVGGIAAIFMAFSALMDKLTMYDITGQKVGLWNWTKAALAMGAFIAVIGVAFKLMQDHIPNTDGLLEKATSMSLVLMAIGGVCTLLSKFNVQFGKAVKGGAGVAVVAAIIVGTIAGIGAIIKAVDSEGDLMDRGVETVNKLTGLLPVIAVCGVVAGAAMAVGKFAGDAAGGAVKFLAVLGIVILVVSAIVMVLGYVQKEAGLTQEMLDSGLEMFKSIGTAIGEFVGNIFSGAAVGMSSGLPEVATNLSTFMANLAPFLEQVKGLTPEVVLNVQNLSSIIDSLNNATFTNEDIVRIGDQLNQFAPYLVTFIKAFEGDAISMDAVDKAVQACTAMADVVAILEPTGGMLQGLTGTKNLGTFSEWLGLFGTNFLLFYDNIKDLNIDQAKVDSAVNAAKIVNGLVEELAPTGGLLQAITGTSDLSTFSSWLPTFAENFVSFYNEISATGFDIDTSKVDTVVNCGKMINGLAKELSPTGGFLQAIVGEQNLSKFALMLPGFAVMFNKFYTAIPKNIDTTQVESVKNAGLMLTELANALPDSGGVFQWWAGEKDLGTFGEQLSKFGEGLTSFYEATKQAGESSASNFIEGLSGGEEECKLAGESLAQSFLDGINSKNNGSTSALYESMTNMANNTVSYLRSGLKINTANISYEIRKIGQYVVDGFIEGIEDRAIDLNDAIRVVCEDMIATAQYALDEHSPSKKFADIGRYTIDGFIKGVNGATDKANNRMSDIAYGFIQAMKDRLEIKSPSRVARDEVGRYIVEGIYDGITNKDLEKDPVKAAEQMAQNIVNAFQKEFDKINLDQSFADTNYNIWENLEGADLSEDEKNTKILEKKGDDLKRQADAIKLAMAEWRGMIAQYGENSDEAQQAQLKYLQQYEKGTQLAREIADLQNSNLEEVEEYSQDDIRALWAAYYDKMLSDPIQDLIKKGWYSEEQLSELIKQQVGLADALAPKPQEEGVKAIDILNQALGEGALDKIETIIAEDVPEVVEESTIESASRLVSSGRAAGGSYAAGFNSGVVDGITNDQQLNQAEKLMNDKLSGILPEEGSNPIADAFKGSMAWTGEQGIDGLLGGLDTLKEKGSGALEGIFGWVTEKANGIFDINSPSKVFYQIGEYVIEGFILGIQKTGARIPSVLASIMAPIANPDRASSNAISDSTSNLLGVVADSITGNEDIVSNSGKGLVITLAETMSNEDEGFYVVGKTLGDKIIEGIKDSLTNGRGEVSNLLGSVQATNYAALWAKDKPSNRSGGGGYPRLNATNYKSLTKVKTMDDFSISIDGPIQKLNHSIGVLTIGTQKLAESMNKATTSTPGATTISYTQNITSPKAVSAAETYRYTKNLISTAKKRVK